MPAEAPAEDAGDCEGRRKLGFDRKVLARISEYRPAHGTEDSDRTGVALWGSRLSSTAWRAEVQG